MKTYKKPYSVVIELDPDDLMQVAMSGTDGDKVIIGNGTESKDNLERDGNGVAWGDSKESSWE